MKWSLLLIILPSVYLLHTTLNTTTLIQNLWFAWQGLASLFYTSWSCKSFTLNLLKKSYYRVLCGKIGNTTSVRQRHLCDIRPTAT